MINIKEGICNFQGTTEQILTDLTLGVKGTYQILKKEFDEEIAKSILEDMLLFGTAENMETAFEKKIKELEEE